MTHPLETFLFLEGQGSQLSARWNDFADVCSFSEAKFDSFRGTDMYASHKLSVLAERRQKNSSSPSSYTYNKLDDCYAVYFTILEFCLSTSPSGRKQRLPWACERLADCWLRKLNWVESPSFDGINGSAPLDLLRTVFTALFKETDYEKGLNLL